MKERPIITENEPEITTTHGTFKQSQLKDVIIRKGDARKPQEKYCPFMRRGCVERCAYRSESDCIAVTGGDLQPGVCPFNQLYTCGDDCTAYAGGNCLFMPRKGVN